MADDSTNIRAPARKRNTSDAPQQFIDAMRSNGLVLSTEFKPDGRIHECDVAAKGKAGIGDGRYCYFSEGLIPAGWFRNWCEGETHNWKFDPGRPLTSNEKREYERTLKTLQRERAAFTDKKQRTARNRARRLWNAASDATDDHPYCAIKRITVGKLRVEDGALLIPMRDHKGAIYNLQTIKADGEKRFLQDGRVRGLHFWCSPLPKKAAKVVVCEGWATGRSIHKATGFSTVIAFNASNLAAVAGYVREKYPDASIVIAADDDWKTKGNPGVKYARQAAEAVNGRIAIPVFKGHRADNATDFNDLAQTEGDHAVTAAFDVACDPGRDDERFDQLARLSTIEYERQRKSAAKELGVRPAILDNEVRARRVALEENKVVGFLRPVDPWPDSVSGDALLGDLCDVISRHIILTTKGQDLAIALWILHAHAHDAARHSPILFISSPTKRCGKTNLLELLSRLVPKPLSAANVTPATVFRSIPVWHPTLLIDEGDTFLADKSELRGVLNSGHTKSQAYVLRCVGDDLIPTQFSTWAPKVFAAIGRMHPTLEDRSIGIQLKRKLKAERIERLPSDENAYHDLRRKCARWAKDHIDGLASAKPRLPDVNDRARDNWCPLLAIAEACGEEWAEEARQVAVKLSGIDDDETFAIQLLQDLQKLFRANAGEALTSEGIVHALSNMQDRPWPEFSHGKAITQRGVAKLLKPFKIKPRQVKAGGRWTQNGYSSKQFTGVFERYLPKKSSGPLKANNSNNLERKNSSEALRHSEELNPRNSLKCRGFRGPEDKSNRNIK